MLPGSDGVWPFATLLRQSRLNADLTQAILAEKAGLSTRAIQHLEAGQGHPYVDTTRRLADALGLAGDERVTFESLARRAPRPRLAHAERRRRTDSPDHGRHNLPSSLTSFIGRDNETAELHERLSHTRLLTLVGVGGCGKSRLAIAVAESMLARFQDGVWLVELAPLVDGALVPQQLASVLGVTELPGQAIVDVLAGALRQCSMLLVLDNCEHLLTACSSLVDTLMRACPHMHFMATSRSVLGALGETVWRVPSLSLPVERQHVGVAELAAFEAVRLFVQRAQAAAPGFRLNDSNADAVARICWWLEGLPLGLELAAARVPTLGVAELAARLDDFLRLLVGRGASRPERHQTLRAAVDWSYELLTAAERDVFVSLSVFAGGCTLEAAEAVCGSDRTHPAAVVDILEQLVDKSLVIAEGYPDGSMRYRLLETLRQYASERLEAAGQADAARARHAAYFCDVLPGWWQPAWWGPDVDRRLKYVERELDNLRGALRWLIAVERVEPALEVGWAMAPFWLVSARVGEGRTWLAKLLALPDSAQPSAARAGVQVWAGGLATQDSDYAAGQKALETGLTLAHRSGDDLALSFALMWLALSAQFRQDRAQARAYAQEALAVSRAGRHIGLEGMNLRILAQVEFDEGNLEDAWRLADDSLAACRAAGHPPGVAWALSALGQVRFRQGAHAAARELLEASLGEKYIMGAPAIRLNALVYLVWTLLEQNALVEARERGLEALELARTVLGGRSFLASPLEAMAQVAQRAGQSQLALVLAGAASARREGGTAPITPTHHTQLEACLAHARGTLDGPSAEAAWIRGRVLADGEAIAHAVTAQAVG